MSYYKHGSPQARYQVQPAVTPSKAQRPGILRNGNQHGNPMLPVQQVQPNLGQQGNLNHQFNNIQLQQQQQHIGNIGSPPARVKHRAGELSYKIRYLGKLIRLHDLNVARGQNVQFPVDVVTGTIKDLSRIKKWYTSKNYSERADAFAAIDEHDEMGEWLFKVTPAVISQMGRGTNDEDKELLALYAAASNMFIDGMNDDTVIDYPLVLQHRALAFMTQYPADNYSTVPNDDTRFVTCHTVFLQLALRIEPAVEGTEVVNATELFTALRVANKLSSKMSLSARLDAKAENNGGKGDTSLQELYDKFYSRSNLRDPSDTCVLKKAYTKATYLVVRIQNTLSVLSQSIRDDIE